jgi:hypothetical protein
LHRRGYPSFDLTVFDLIVPVDAAGMGRGLSSLPLPRADRFGFCERPLPEGVVSTTSGYWPLGLFFWFMARVETLLGWAFGLMFVAIVSGLVKKD